MDFNQVYAELREVIAAQWPEVVNGGDGGRRIFETEAAAGIPFEQMVDHGLPFAVISIPEAVPMQMGLANRSYALYTELYLVRETSQGSEGLRPRLEAMCAFLRGTGLTTGTVWDDPDPAPDWSWESEINEVLRTKKIPALAGLASLLIVISETD